MLNILSATVGEVFAYIGYVLLALLALMAMIVVHELGHYTAGKLLGFKIDEFAIGFGPKIFKRKNKKTGELFSIRPFPIGGFCAFHGEDADGALLDENGNQVKDANGNIIKDPDAFNNQKPWKRLIVLFSGAFMNFLSAILIITIYFPLTVNPFRTWWGRMTFRAIKTCSSKATFCFRSTENRSISWRRKTLTTSSKSGRQCRI